VNINTNYILETKKLPYSLNITYIRPFKIRSNSPHTIPVSGYIAASTLLYLVINRVRLWGIVNGQIIIILRAV